MLKTSDNQVHMFVKWFWNISHVLAHQSLLFFIGWWRRSSALQTCNWLNVEAIYSKIVKIWSFNWKIWLSISFSSYGYIFLYHFLISEQFSFVYLPSSLIILSSGFVSESSAYAENSCGLLRTKSKSLSSISLPFLTNYTCLFVL